MTTATEPDTTIISPASSTAGMNRIIDLDHRSEPWYSYRADAQGLHYENDDFTLSITKEGIVWKPKY